jgi:hypothetical protein
MYQAEQGSRFYKWWQYLIQTLKQGSLELYNKATRRHFLTQTQTIYAFNEPATEHITAATESTSDNGR